MRRSIYALLSAVSLSAISTVASAQTAPADAEPASEELTADTVTAPEEQEQLITVTGSRLVSNGAQAPTPVTVLSAASLEQHAAPSIPEALRELPALTKSSGPRSNPSSSGGSDPGASSGTFLDLRNLGPQRMLLLLDGQRVPPTRSDGRTDANIIPQLLVSRVEVVTGGASAAYGSDAVSGVVNYILDNRYNGLKGVAQYGLAQRGDGRNYRFGLAGGQSFVDDRLHIVASAEFRRDDGIRDFCDRPYGCDRYIVGGANGPTGAGTTPGNPYVAYSGVNVPRVTMDGFVAGAFNANNTANAAANAQLNVSAGRSLVYNPATGAVLVPYVPGTLITPNFCINCSGASHSSENITLVPKLETKQYYGHAEFDVTPDITVWGQINAGEAETFQTTGNNTWFSASGNWIGIFSGNAYLSPAVQSVLTSTGASFLQINTYRDDFPQPTFSTLSKNFSLSGGVRGKIGEDWQWKVYGIDSESSVRSRGGNFPENNKFYAALDAVRDPAGNIVCNVTLTNPGAFPGCVPLNILGRGSPSQEALDYILDDYEFTQTTTLKGYGGEVTGQPFSTWAGPVGLAVGYEWREQTLDVVSNTNIPIVTSGVRFGNGNRVLRFRGFDSQPASGAYTVSEFFGELDVPLLKDVRLGGVSIAQSLSLNGAVRFTDYSTSGKVTTWKLGGSWQIDDDLRIRATRSRDVRAPTLDDLFRPEQRTNAQFIDPHTNNTQSSVVTISSGNLNLKPEKADTWTVGAVWRPSYIPGLTASVDWYSIEMSDAIQLFGGPQLVAACEASNGTSALCDAVVRPFPFENRTPANVPLFFFAQSFNAVELIVRGIDFEASYSRPLLGGQVRARALATYQYDYRTQSSPQNPLVDSAGYVGAGPPGGAPVASPKLMMSASVGYENGPFGIDVLTRRIGSWNRDSPPGTLGILNYYQEPVVKPYYYTSLALTYDIEASAFQRLQLYFNVNNLFDTKPPLLPSTEIPGLRYPTERSLYDVVLRDFSVGVRFEF